MVDEKVEETEEQLTELRSQLETKDADLTKALSRMQGLEGSLKEKDRLLAEQVDIRSELDTVKGMVKIMATEGYGMQEQNLEAPPEKKASIDKMFADMEVSSKQRHEADKKTREQEEFNTKADTIYSKAKEVFKNDKDMLERVETQLLLGKFDRAEELISEAKPKEEKKETEEEIEARLRKKWEIETGQRDAETGQPKTSSGGLTQEIIEKMSPSEQWERSKEISDFYKNK